jgi:hypothetical protein
MQNTCIAFNEIIIDALIVMQSRQDKNGGSSNLTSYAKLVSAFGGFLGAFLAAFVI